MSLHLSGPGGHVRLPTLGVLRVRGSDAASFLQSQLTQDVLHLGPHQAALAAWCSAKGRMLASFIVIAATDDSYWLVCERDGLAAVARRLGMFVLRAKVQIDDASDALAVFGLAGDGVPDALRAGPAWQRIDPQPGVAVVAFPPGENVPLALWAGPADIEPTSAELADGLWPWLEVSSGVARIGAALSDQLVPQMVNYESVGGVSFRKGCYPGQEVVARSQFRGTLKRRGFLLNSQQPLHAGQALFQSGDPDQPCGVVVQGAKGPAGDWRAIASVQVAAAAGATVRVGSADGPPAQVLPPPYRLLDDV